MKGSKIKRREFIRGIFGTGIAAALPIQIPQKPIQAHSLFLEEGKGYYPVSVWVKTDGEVIMNAPAPLDMSLEADDFTRKIRSCNFRIEMEPLQTKDEKRLLQWIKGDSK